MNRYVVAQPGTGRTALVYANTEAQALSLFRQYFRLQRDAAQLTCDRIARNVGGDAHVVPVIAADGVEAR